MRQSVLQVFAPLRKRRRKISLRILLRPESLYPVVKTLQSFAAALDAFFLRRAGRRDHGDGASRDERQRFARFRHGRGQQKGIIQCVGEADTNSPRQMLPESQSGSGLSGKSICLGFLRLKVESNDALSRQRRGGNQPGATPRVRRLASPSALKGRRIPAPFQGALHSFAPATQGVALR